jgi:hypothetical protein
MPEEFSRGERLSAAALSACATAAGLMRTRGGEDGVKQIAPFQLCSRLTRRAGTDAAQTNAHATER